MRSAESPKASQGLFLPIGVIEPETPPARRGKQPCTLPKRSSYLGRIVPSIIRSQSNSVTRISGGGRGLQSEAGIAEPEFVAGLQTYATRGMGGNLDAPAAAENTGAKGAAVIVNTPVARSGVAEKMSVGAGDGGVDGRAIGGNVVVKKQACSRCVARYGLQRR